MAFGKRVGTMKALKKELKKGGASPLAFIPKDGELSVRFLTEPVDWVSFTEVWDTELNRGYPLPDDPDMPGGTPDEDARSSTRYVAPVLLIEDNRVVVLQLPKSLVDSLTLYYDKFHTILDRDYDLMRSGSGLNTEYGAIVDAPRKRKPIKDIPSPEDALEEAYNLIFGDADDEEEEAPARKKKSPSKPSGAAAKRRAKSVEEDEEEEDYEEDEEDFEEEELEEEELDEEEDFEDEEEDEDDDDEEEVEEDEEEVWTEDELAELTLADLKAVAVEYGVKNAARMKKKQTLIDAIMGLDPDAF